MNTKNPERVGGGNAFEHRYFTTSRPQSLPFSKSLATLSPVKHLFECVLNFGGGELSWSYAKVKNSRREPVLLLPDEHPEHYFWPVYGWGVLAKQYGDYPMDKVLISMQN